MKSKPRTSFSLAVLFGLMAAVLAALPSCSVTKYVPQDRYLLDRTQIVSDVPDIQDAELESYLAQRSNFRVFGLCRLRLATYSLSGRDTTKRRNRWLKKMGEPPVLYDEYQTRRGSKRLENFFRTKGYMDVSVSDSVAYDGRRASVVYTVHEGTPYRLRNIEFDFHNDTLLGGIIQHSRFNATSNLRPGGLFDVDVLDSERSRLVSIARRNGYYYFGKDDISFVADSSLRSHQVDLKLVLKPYVADDGGVRQELMHPRYTIRNINVLMLPNASARAEADAAYDSVYASSSTRLFFLKHPLLRKKVVLNNLRIVPGMWYNDFFVNQTYNRFSGLGIVRATEINFADNHTQDHTLDCNVVVSPNTVHSFSLDLEGTNSSGDLGFAVTGMMQHRNLFRGSELLSLKLRYAQEAVTNNNELVDVWNDRVQEVNVEASLRFPQFVFPFVSGSFRRRVNSSTEVLVAFGDQRRPEYTRKILTGSFKYHWVQHRFYSYTIDALNVNYVYLPWISESFLQRYSDPKYSVLLNSYKDHLIFGAGFTLAYNNQNLKSALHKHSFRISLESAGNLLYGLASLCDFDKGSDGDYRAFDIPFSQFVKGSFDYSYNRLIDSRNHIVWHGRIGLEYPYGNSDDVPFEKRFYAGGASGVRGWSVRTLGPGSYVSPMRNDFVSQSGDIELTANVEYRSKLFWVIEGGVFVDAGNVWNIKDYEFQKEGTFRFDRFYKQIALAYGLGLRFDFNYFLVRTDVGAKLFDPSLDSVDRWRVRHVTWHDDFAFHLAIGYPF